MRMKKLRLALTWITLASLLFSVFGTIPVQADNTISSSTIIFEGTLTDNGDGTYTGVLPCVDEATAGLGDNESGYDIYARNGATAWFGDDPGSGPVWNSVAIGTSPNDHDAWSSWDPDTPDWYQYSLNLYVDGGEYKWAVRNHPGATAANPWSSDPATYPPKGVPMSGAMDWTNMYATETDVGAYLPGTGTPEIPGGAAGKGGGPAAWDMDWSWGSEVVPLEYPGFDVDVTDLGAGQYRVTLTPATAPIEVSQPTHLTGNSAYDRNPSIIYDGTDYWLFYTKGDDTSTSGVRGGSYNPDSDTYVVYYKKASTIAGLAAAAETKLGVSESARPTNFDQRVVSAVYFNSKVYAFVSSGQSGTDRGLYYYEYSGSWSGPTTLIADATARGGHVNVTGDSNRVYIVWESSDASSDAYTWDGATLSSKIDISTDNQPKITLMGTTLYVVSIEDGTGDIEVYSAGAGASPSFSSHSTAISAAGFYDPCIFNDGTNLYVVTAPYDGGDDQQYLMQTRHDGTSWYPAKMVSYGGYGATYWWDYWPVGYHDGSDAYVFFTTETSSPTYSDGEIAYIKMDWDLNYDHYFYIQNAVDQASDGDTINVAAGNGYHGAIIDKEVVIDGADGGASVVTSGVPYKSGSGLTTAFRLDAGADNTEIRNFTIQCDQASSFYFGVFSRGVDDVIVDSLTVNDSVQGITNWGGSNWEITNNDLSDTVAAGGGGIAIFLGARPTDHPVCSGNLVQDNVMSSASTEAGYTSPGIFFGLDARGKTIPDDLSGSEDVSYNRIIENTISGTGNTNEVGIETGVIGVSGDSAAVTATMGIVHDNDVQTNTIDHSDYGLYAYIVKDLTVTGNVVKNCATHGVSIWDDFTGEINSNNIQGNNYGLYSDVSARTIDAENNWWGDASGPGPVGPGSGDNVSTNVDYDPWLAGIAPGTLQAVIDAASPGDVIYLGPYTYEGGIIINKAVTLQGQEGTVIGPGSPAYTVNADDIVIKDQVIDGDPTDTGTNSSDPGILVKADADNLTVENCESKRWEDGIEIEGDVTSLKVAGNWIHDNTDAGLQVDSGVTVDGIVTIEGNLFKNNGTGIRNDGVNNLTAQYNSWGVLAGPSGGDTAGATAIDTSNFTFAEVFLDVGPDDEKVQRDVNESESLTVTVKTDAAKLYGLEFKLTYEAGKLQFDALDDNVSFKGGASCSTTHSVSGTVGTITYLCNRQTGDAEYDANGGDVLDIGFTAIGTGLTGAGPWTALFDIAHAEADTNAGAKGGIKVYMNNAGFGDPSDPDRNITDTNDGQIDITGIAKFTGFVDLQGRTNDSGAIVDVYDQTTQAGATKLASGTSASGGGYTTDYIGSHLLTIGTTYWFLVDAPLYLPTTPVTETIYYDSHALDTRPLTTLNNVKLLGGDATNDDTISVSDASCIGGDYGQTSDFTECGGSGSGGTSDVNGDNVIDILDLVLMGGNYSLSSSSWTP